MKKVLLKTLFVGVLFASSSAQAKSVCDSDAIAQAGKLLTFHFGEDSRIFIDDKVKKLVSIKNPANKRQTFEVLEVWGYIYKGQYRLRLIYYPLSDGSCVLMGQEILEFASL